MVMSKTPVYGNSLFGSSGEFPIENNYERIRLERPAVYYCKGTNGSGKTTVPMMCIKHDKDAYYLNRKNESKIIATVSPKFKMIFLFKYDPYKTHGGCDMARGRNQIFELLEEFYSCMDYDIFFEGMMLSATISTYAEWIQKRKAERIPIVLTLSTPIEVCFERLDRRNKLGDGESEKSLKKVKLKYDSIIHSTDVYNQDYPDLNLWELDTSGTIEEVFKRFLNNEFKNLRV